MLVATTLLACGLPTQVRDAMAFDVNQISKFHNVGAWWNLHIVVLVRVRAAAPPAWCCTIDGDAGACPDHASFDPEGITSTFTCVVASLIGLHFGHIYKFVPLHILGWENYLPFS